MTILAISLNGNLRLRAFKGGKTAVVELRTGFDRDRWIYCVYRSLPIDRALELFNNQCYFHTEKNTTDVAA